MLDAIAEHGPEDENMLNGRIFINDSALWHTHFGRDGNGGAAGAAAHGEPETVLAWREVGVACVRCRCSRIWQVPQVTGHASLPKT